MDWSGISFYYVPFKMAIMSNIMTYASVSDVLISNDASSFERLTSANYDRYGPAGALLFANLVSVIGTDSSKSDALNRICDGNNPITRETLQIVYDIIVLAETVEGTYDFLSFDDVSTTTLATVSYSSSEVWSVFGESLTYIDFNDSEITSAIPGVSVTVGTAVEAVPNQIAVCTRFAIDGVNVRIHGIVFDQTLCTYTTIFSQTPILFSGAFATLSSVYNNTIINSRAAVVVLGGNSVVYTFQPIISANRMVIHDINFEYVSIVHEIGEQRREAGRKDISIIMLMIHFFPFTGTLGVLFRSCRGTL